MPLSEPDFSKVSDVARLIQMALTPVFLLTGIGTLINVFAQRLARVADQVDKVTAALDGTPIVAGHDPRRRLVSLKLRSLALDVAVILAAVAGAATCGAVLTLFVGALRDSGVALALYILFGAAIVSTIGALVAFLFEMLVASTFIRLEVQRGEGRTGP